MITDDSTGAISQLLTAIVAFIMYLVGRSHGSSTGSK